MDAIIVFSDILIVAEAMGMPLDVPDSGPVLSNPFLETRRRCGVCVNSIPERETRFVGDAMRAIRRAGPDVPLIGFAAAPARSPVT